MKAIHPKEKGRAPDKVIELNGKTHQFWQIDNADEMLHSRYMVAEIQELYLRAGLSEDFLKEIADILINLGMESKDFKTLRHDIVAVGQNLKGRISMLAERQMYEEMACVYFLMDDEPLEYIQSWQALKKEVWEASNERDFFIVKAFRLINDLPAISNEDILTAFQAVSERIAQLPTLKNL